MTVPSEDLAALQQRVAALEQQNAELTARATMVGDALTDVVARLAIVEMRLGADPPPG